MQVINALVKYSALFFAGYLTFITVNWSFGYADVNEPDNNVAIVIAAVQGLVLALNAYLAKLFIGKNND